MGLTVQFFDSCQDGRVEFAQRKRLAGAPEGSLVLSLSSASQRQPLAVTRDRPPPSRNWPRSWLARTRRPDEIGSTCVRLRAAPMSSQLISNGGANLTDQLANSHDINCSWRQRASRAIHPPGAPLRKRCSHTGSLSLGVVVVVVVFALCVVTLLRKVFATAAFL